MRTITLICALLVLASCGGSPEAQKKDDFHGTSNADSSPIIISDGSTLVKHGKPGRDHFTDKNPTKDDEIKAVNYAPKALGYLCDPSSHPPSANTCASVLECPKDPTVPTGACKVVFPSNTEWWDLSLCENSTSCSGNGTVRVKWIKADPESMKIHSNGNNFSYKNATASDGAELKHVISGQVLQSAKLDVKLPGGGQPTTYLFPCTMTGSTCLPNVRLTVGYDCQGTNLCQ
jgi:hypothetical protein